MDPALEQGSGDGEVLHGSGDVAWRDVRQVHLAPYVPFMLCLLALSPTCLALAARASGLVSGLLLALALVLLGFPLLMVFSVWRDWRRLGRNSRRWSWRFTAEGFDVANAQGLSASVAWTAVAQIGLPPGRAGAYKLRNDSRTHLVPAAVLDNDVRTRVLQWAGDAGVQVLS